MQPVTAKKTTPEPGTIVAHSLTSDLAAGGARAKKALASIRDALTACDGNVSHAARELGASRWTLIRWLEDHADLKDLAARLRANSDQASERMAHARAARKTPKK